VNKNNTSKTRYSRVDTREEETKDNGDSIGLTLFKTRLGNLMKKIQQLT